MSDPRTKVKESKQYHPTKSSENQADPHNAIMDVIKKGAQKFETLHKEHTKD